MAIYKVKIKDTEAEVSIEASSELEARVKFCKEKQLPYRVYANKLEVTKQEENPDK